MGLRPLPADEVVKVLVKSGFKPVRQRGKYRYPESEIKRLLGEQAPKGKVAIYARVSSADQRERTWRGRSRGSSSTPRARATKT